MAKIRISVELDVDNLQPGKAEIEMDVMQSDLPKLQADNFIAPFTACYEDAMAEFDRVNFTPHWKKSPEYLQGATATGDEPGELITCGLHGVKYPADMDCPDCTLEMEADIAEGREPEQDVGPQRWPSPVARRRRPNAIDTGLTFEQTYPEWLPDDYFNAHCAGCGTPIYVGNYDEADALNYKCSECSAAETRAFLEQAEADYRLQQDSEEFPYGEFPDARRYTDPDWGRGWD